MFNTYWKLDKVYYGISVAKFSNNKFFFCNDQCGENENNLTLFIRWNQPRVSQKPT